MHRPIALGMRRHSHKRLSFSREADRLRQTRPSLARASPKVYQGKPNSKNNKLIAIPQPSGSRVKISNNSNNSNNNSNGLWNKNGKNSKREQMHL